jgi:hypothetical protein
VACDQGITIINRRKVPPATAILYTCLAPSTRLGEPYPFVGDVAWWAEGKDDQEAAAKLGGITP